MTRCFFVTDLHGSLDRYRKLYRLIKNEEPEAVFMGGDLLPSGMAAFIDEDIFIDDFVGEYMAGLFVQLMNELNRDYPRIFIILGNDDGRSCEIKLISGDSDGIWHYIHNRKVGFKGHDVYGYSFVPPTPFLLKDWERYDVSRYVDPGSISPEDGVYSQKISSHELKYSTIKEDLEKLAGSDDLTDSIFLFHSPPHETMLDRAAFDGRMIDHVPLDLHVGSIAIRRLIEKRQPMLTLHGHIHESARLTGCWRDRIGRTHLFSAAHDGPELCLVRFDLEDLDSATRELV